MPTINLHIQKGMYLIITCLFLAITQTSAFAGQYQQATAPPAYSYSLHRSAPPLTIPFDDMLPSDLTYQNMYTSYMPYASTLKARAVEYDIELGGVVREGNIDYRIYYLIIIALSYILTTAYRVRHRKRSLKKTT